MVDLNRKGEDMSGYWIKKPTDDLRAVLRSIGQTHVSDEFVRALTEDFYDKRWEFGDDELKTEREPEVNPQTGWEE